MLLGKSPSVSVITRPRKLRTHGGRPVYEFLLLFLCLTYYHGARWSVRLGQYVVMGHGMNVGGWVYFTLCNRYYSAKRFAAKYYGIR